MLIKYIRDMQDKGRKVDPDLVGSQGLKASGAKPEMVGQTSSTKKNAQDFVLREMLLEIFQKQKVLILIKHLKIL